MDKQGVWKCKAARAPLQPAAAPVGSKEPGRLGQPAAGLPYNLRPMPQSSDPKSSSDPEPREITGRLVLGQHRIAIAVGRFNEFITRHLLEGCVATWRQLGGTADRLTVAHVPGSFELPATALKLAETGDYAAVICLGCVIRGDTDHYDHVVQQTAKGIKDVGVKTGVPTIFGVLTCDTLEQAIHRAGAKMGHAGRSAMMTAVEMADLMQQVGNGSASDPPHGR